MTSVTFDVQVINEQGSDFTVRARGELRLRFDGGGHIEVCRTSSNGVVEVLAKTGSKLATSDLRIALLYKYASLLRGAWIGEPLDLRPEGITEAYSYFRDGSFKRRLKFLGLDT